MAQNVYRCALDEGVRRVVTPSSNHAADWYEHRLIHSQQREMVCPSDLPLSDNPYGWARPPTSSSGSCTPRGSSDGGSKSSGHIGRRGDIRAALRGRAG
jgi:hypothetical protein